MFALWEPNIHHKITMENVTIDNVILVVTEPFGSCVIDDHMNCPTRLMHLNMDFDFNCIAVILL